MLEDRLNVEMLVDTCDTHRRGWPIMALGLVHSGGNAPSNESPGARVLFPPIGDNAGPSIERVRLSWSGD